MINKKVILVIGATSKIAQKFIRKYDNNFDIIQLTRRDIDLLDIDNINNNLEIVLNGKKINSILFFSSIYEEGNNFLSLNKHIKINSLSLYLITDFLIKNKLLLTNSKFIYLTDGGTDNPKKGFLGYTASKDLLKSLIKSLAINYTNYVFLGIDLGPIETDKKGKDRIDFFSRSIINMNNPGNGLINFINFLINEENFFSTGKIIDFTGGTYLKRC